MAVITDSTAGLSEGQLAGIGVVPLTVTVGGRSGVEGVDVTPADVARALGERRISVVTSRPSPTELSAAYRAALDDGAEAVVAIHLSSRLSGTYSSAVAASKEFGAGVVSVVDSGSTAMGLGFPVRAAAAVALDGGDATAVRAAAEVAVRQTTTLFYVDTLEYLRRGGRIGAAAALVGTALAVKPILRIDTGGVTLAERVRTSARGLARLEALAIEQAGDRTPVNIAVQHLAAPERAETLAARLADHLPGIKELLITEVGAVIGAHVGPGVVGVVISPC
ncbi:DegV family protein [Fodinicola feengrottensis]|uniref:DegV family protein n=1 Tax=Fodinicola feengrottensis TaxID=435914 RepID=UPI0031CF438A